MTSTEQFLTKGAMLEVEFNAGGDPLLGCLIEVNPAGLLLYLGSMAATTQQRRALVPWSAVKVVHESHRRLQSLPVEDSQKWFLADPRLQEKLKNERS